MPETTATPATQETVDTRVSIVPEIADLLFEKASTPFQAKSIRAVQMTVPFRVEEINRKGQATDWIVRFTDGFITIIADKEFRELYRATRKRERKAKPGDSLK